MPVYNVGYAVIHLGSNARAQVKLHCRFLFRNHLEGESHDIAAGKS